MVTGATGFIGGALFKKLSKDELDPIGIDLNYAEQFRRRSASLLRVDVSDFRSLVEVMKGIDVVFHLAGPIRAAASKDFLQAARLQLEGTITLLRAMAETGARKVILASSVSVYEDISSVERVTEDTQIDIAGCPSFGWIKLTAEELVMRFCQSQGLDYAILRLGSVYGPGSSTNLLGDFMARALSNHQLSVWGLGKRRVQFVYVDDAVDAMLMVQNVRRCVFNIASAERVSVRAVAELVCEQMGVSYELLSARAEGPSLPYIVTRKAEELLGWRPRTLKQGLQMFKEMVSEFSEAFSNGA